MNLSVQIFASLILSVVVGLILGPDAAPWVKLWVAPIGTMFINLIKMMIVPVILSSLVTGMTGLGDLKKLGRIGVKTLIMYMGTTAIAILLGFGAAMLIHPGVGLDMGAAAAPEIKQAPTFMEVLVNMIPKNPVESMANADILPLIVFSIFLGAGIVAVGGKKGVFLTQLFDALAEVCYKVIGMIMRVSPIGVFCLLVPVVVNNGPKVLLPLLSVIVAAAIGSIAHMILVYTPIVSFIGKIKVIDFYRAMSEAMMIAFTTCSSAGTLPVNMKNLIEKLKIKKEVVSFVLPLGATINMDGTAVYMGVCALFVANVYGIHLTINQMIMIMFTGTLASIGTAGVPGGGLIMLAMVLQSANLPLEGIALVAGIDRVLDMFRTTLNITGDATVACAVDRTERKYDKELLEEANKEREENELK
ncbi:Na+/H+-dicarboxylate symporter [Dialister histaminiformans]|uniref:Na+/H+-dicarboxylate symporter n=1 Tax=Allisonella histaminiformans TaxID=209880 RepID=A0A1G5WSX5_9FIRM|nr:dicarboxylate/amino acid:cation symporter [Allisonella histaminiformans]SDA61278.1 Na+/H+-dicarboxylate symporter [Allisonella histaminiformans]